MSAPAYPFEESLPPFDHKRVLKYTQSPNPTWPYGQRLSETTDGNAWLSGEKEGWSVYNPEEHEPRSIVVPDAALYPYVDHRF